MNYATKACSKVLPCGHGCCGMAGENTCLPCLHGCTPKTNTNKDYTASELCAICYTETLAECPTIQLECGHMFHYDCVRNMLKNRWNGHRVTFVFCLCPTCKKAMNHPALKDLLDPIKTLYDELIHKATTRLKYDGRQNTDDIKRPDGLFYKNPGAYALDIYVYYICHKCQKPYFGGEAQCEVQMEGMERKAEDFTCGLCSEATRSKVCSEHGPDYLGHKCRYCCSLASIVCGGHSHYCKDCYRDAARLNNLPANQLPKCPVGPKGVQLTGPCPLGVNHPPEGRQEFAFGCAMCLNATTF